MRGEWGSPRVAGPPLCLTLLPPARDQATKGGIIPALHDARRLHSNPLLPAPIDIPTGPHPTHCQAAPSDPRIVCVVLAAPQRTLTEAQLMPGLVARVAALEEAQRREMEAAAAAVAEADADLAGLLDEGEGGGTPGGSDGGGSGVSPIAGGGDGGTGAASAGAANADAAAGGARRGAAGSQQPQPAAAAARRGLCGSGQVTSDLFGPRAEACYLLDPFGSMIGPGSGGSRGNPGAPLLQQLLAQSALALRPRSPLGAGALPDPGEEAAADTRVGTWREALRAQHVAEAAAAQAQEQAAWAAEQEEWERQQAEREAAADDWRWAYDNASDSTEWMVRSGGQAWRASSRSVAALRQCPARHGRLRGPATWRAHLSPSVCAYPPTPSHMYRRTCPPRRAGTMPARPASTVGAGWAGTLIGALWQSRASLRTVA